MATPAKRDHLAAVTLDPPPDHPGLAMHRYLAEHADAQQKQSGQRPEVALLQCAAGAVAGEAYRAALARWKELHRSRPGCFCFEGTLTAPLAVGLGTESPLEVGLTTHHTYGMPVIPGSALKGLCRRGALRHFQVETADKLEKAAKREFGVLFGNPAGAGGINFWDAWYDPGNGEGKPFKQDVLTVHHPRYYQQGGKHGAWPTDFDNPNPVPFLVVRPGARFFFVLSAPDAWPPGWLEFAVRLAQWSLEHLGAGGKTNAGYGGFRFEPWTPPPPPARKETWPDCRLTQQVDRGVATITVAGDRGTCRLGQKQGAALKREMTEPQKAALKKRGLRAAVKVSRQGENVEFVCIEMWIEGGV